MMSGSLSSVVYEKITHRPAAGSRKIDRGAPWRLMAVGEEIGRDRRQIIPLGAEVVVDDVEKHSEPALVTGAHERLERLGPAVA